MLSAEMESAGGDGSIFNHSLWRRKSRLLMAANGLA
jgi:hypothetical protein